MEERQIIKSLKEGDREAFSMLYKQYWEKVYHFCGLYLNNRDVAEDVVQEVFIKVWMRIGVRGRRQRIIWRIIFPMKQKRN